MLNNEGNHNNPQTGGGQKKPVTRRLSGLTLLAAAAGLRCRFAGRAWAGTRAGELPRLPAEDKEDAFVRLLMAGRLYYQRGAFYTVIT